MTLGIYVHSDKARLRAAVEALPGAHATQPVGVKAVAG
jgi:hypothetical protein